jgi:hypothetical protein
MPALLRSESRIPFGKYPGPPISYGANYVENICFSEESDHLPVVDTEAPLTYIGAILKLNCLRAIRISDFEGLHHASQ